MVKTLKKRDYEFVSIKEEENLYANAVTKDYYNKHLQEVRNRKIVMIFDECHRSHFGECHKNIVKFFNNIQLFGFTGTPIFVENANLHTTAEVFGDCMHRYLIKDAIADENVLGFLVEYYKGKDEAALDYDDVNLRMKKKKPEMEPLDLLLVVGMFLTGFDAKKIFRWTNAGGWAKSAGGKKYTC